MEDSQQFLTTREVAELLRVKERKVYELVSEQAIPVSRATGKLLFPRALVEAWILRHLEYRDDLEALVSPPPVIAGSHDPLLEWAIRESGCGLATYFDGSLDGLARMADGDALGAGMHVFEPRHEGFNRAHVAERLSGMPVVLVELFKRCQGLVVARGNPRSVQAPGDLAGLRLIPRQKNSGSHVLLEHLLAEAGVAVETLIPLDPPARTEADVALAVATDKADAGLAIESVARQHGLGFVPLFQERYDLLVWRREYFEAPLQTLLGFHATPAFRQRATEVGGYDLSEFGRVRFNGA